MRRLLLLYQVSPKVSIHASVKDATIKTAFNDFLITVSIHASVKDATTYRERLDSFNPVSIHASVKDATKTDISRCISITSFNPRICKRCDLICPLSNMADKDGFNPRICKRCDKRRLILFSIIGSFNPRICKRCDLQQVGIISGHVKFQSTHL